MEIGVLALQGAFVEHIAVLEGLKARAKAVRLPQHLEGLDGLIIPGGESTAIGRLMGEYGLREPLERLAREGFPLFGTCAGLVLLAQKVNGLSQFALGLMDIQVKRNAFGRQVDSFEAPLSVPVLGDKPFPGVFIRAPWIEEVGSGVEVMARLPQGPMVAARQGNLLVAAFHPELTDDTRFHTYFMDMVTRRLKGGRLSRKG